jgi:hypothetical protein
LKLRRVAPPRAISALRSDRRCSPRIKEIAMPQARAERNLATKYSLTQRWAPPPWVAAWTLFAPFAMAGASGLVPYFLCYNKNGGIIKIGQPIVNGGQFNVSFVPTPQQGVLQLELINLVPFLGHPYLLAQKAGDPNATFVQVVQNAASGLYSIDFWPTGVPASGQLLPLVSGTEHYIAAYDGSQLTLYQLDPVSRTTKPLVSQAWGSGWTAFASLGDSQPFIGLKEETGDLRIGQIMNGTLSAPIPVNGLNNPPIGCNALTPLANADGPTFLAYQRYSQNTAPSVYTVDLAQTPPVKYKWTYDDCPQNVASIGGVLGAQNDEFYLIYQATETATAAQASGGSTLMIASGMKPGYPDDNPPPPRRHGR